VVFHCFRAEISRKFFAKKCCWSGQFVFSLVRHASDDSVFIQSSFGWCSMFGPVVILVCLYVGLLGFTALISSVVGIINLETTFYSVWVGITYAFRFTVDSSSNSMNCTILILPTKKKLNLMECTSYKSNKNRQCMGLSIVLPTCLANIRTVAKELMKSN